MSAAPRIRYDDDVGDNFARRVTLRCWPEVRLDDYLNFATLAGVALHLADRTAVVLGIQVA